MQLTAQAFHPAFSLEKRQGWGKYSGIRTVEAERRGSYISHYTLPSNFDYS